MAPSKSSSKKSKSTASKKTKAKGIKGLSSRNTTLINKSLQPIPMRYICQMKYSQTVLTQAAGNVGSYVFNLNSLFDPDRTGTGHQPYGFDNLALLYNRYRVIGCAWNIQRAMLASDNPVCIGAMATNDINLSYATFSEFREQPRARYVLQNAGAGVISLSGYTDIAKLTGRPKTAYMADDHYGAIVNQSPIENALLFVQTAGANDVPSSVLVQVTLKYTVEFYDQKHVVQS